MTAYTPDTADKQKQTLSYCFSYPLIVSAELQIQPNLSIKPALTGFCSRSEWENEGNAWQCLQTSLPWWDGSSGSAHGNALGARTVQVVLSVDGESVMAMGGWKRWHHRGTGEVGSGQWQLHLFSFGLTTSHAYVIVVGAGGGGCRRPEGGPSKGVALPHHSEGSCGARIARCPTVELTPLRSQNSVGGSSRTVDQDALLAGAGLARAGSHGPGLWLGDGTHDERVGEVHASAQASLALALLVGLRHAVEVDEVAEAQRGQVEPGVLLLVGVLDGHADLHVVRRPRAVVVLPLPHHTFPWGRRRLVEVPLHWSHGA